MLPLFALFVLPLLTAHASAVSKRYTPPNANCVDYEIPVLVSTKGVSFVAPKWTDNYGLTNFVSLGATRSSANFSAPLTGPVDLSGNYTISATFCSPKTKNGNWATVLLASHGLGYDRSYWNPAYEPEKYNFAQYALARGYPVFFYDRLGTGQSSAISGFVNQASIQVQILGQLTGQIKNGQYTGTVGNPKKIVLVGHSFGSFISNALLAESPEIADGAILTGLAFAQDSQVSIEAFILRVAAMQNKKWKDLDAGYVIWDDIYGNINNFFKAPTYTIDAAKFSEDNKVPLAITELLTVSTLNYNATSFKGPVLILNGEYDFIVCGGYCPGVIEEPAATFFQNAKNFKTVSQPNTGHGLNFHINATGGFQVIAEYLKEQGL